MDMTSGHPVAYHSLWDIPATLYTEKIPLVIHRLKTVKIESPDAILAFLTILFDILSSPTALLSEKALTVFINSARDGRSDIGWTVGSAARAGFCL